MHDFGATRPGTSEGDGLPESHGCRTTAWRLGDDDPEFARTAYPVVIHGAAPDAVRTDGVDLGPGSPRHHPSG